MPVYTYTTIDEPRANFRTDPTAINDAGTIVGTYVDLTGNHGFLYSGGTYATLDAPGATGTTRASGINASRLIVGDYTTADGSHGFLYSNGTYTTLDDPLATTARCPRHQRLRSERRPL